VRVAEALKAGWLYTFSRWPGTLLVASAAIAEALAGLALMMAFFSVSAGPRTFIPGLLGATVAGVLARLMQLSAQAGAVRSGARWVTAQPEEAPLTAAWQAMPKAVAFFAFSLPIDAAFFLWKWLGLFALIFGLPAAFTKWSGALGESGAIALYLFLSLLLLVLDGVWRKAALARAMVHDRGVARSLFEALGLLAERPLARATAALVPMIVAGGIVFFFDLLAGVVTQAADKPSVILQIGGELASGVPGAFAIAFGELVALQALAALDLPATTAPAVATATAV
jgi:hypothetical protein